MSDTKYLAQEYQELLWQSSAARNEWQRIGEYLLPNLSGITVRGMEGYKKTRKLYDTTGIDALDKLTTLIISTATSEVIRWFGIAHSDPDINLLPEVQYWCEDTSNRMFDAINASNYKSAGPEALREDGGFGTGNLFCQEIDEHYNPISGFRGLFFTAVPIGTYVIQEDGLNRVTFQTREYTVPIRSVLERWPEGEYSRETRKLAAEKPFQRVSVMHDVRPDKRKFKSCYYLRRNSNGIMPTSIGMSSGELEQCSEGMFEEFPHFIARWDKATGEVWGFGRGHLALPEVATLNRARQLKLRQWALSVNPPIMVLDDGVNGQARIVPGALNRIRVPGAMEPFVTGANFSHEAIPENESKLQIRQIFFTEQILQFAPQAKTPPSATEVMQRMEFLHSLLGPSLGRLQTDRFRPMLRRVYKIMDRAKAFLPMPEILKVDGRLQFEFEGPLARAQRADDLRAIGDTLAVVSNLAAIDPEAWDNYNIDLMSRDAARLTGASKRYLRSEEERDQRRAQRQEEQAQQAQMAQMVQGADAAKSLGAATASFAKAEEGAV